MPSPFQIMHSCRCTVVTCQPSRLAVTHHIQNTARHVSLCDARLRQSRVSGCARQCHLLSIAHTYNLLSWGAVISCIWWITTTCSWVLLRQWLHKYTQKFMKTVIIYTACNKNNRLRSLTGLTGWEVLQASATCTNGDPFSGIKCGWGMMLTTYPHLVLRSRMSRNYTSSSSWSLHGGSGTALLFFFYKVKFSVSLFTHRIQVKLSFLNRTIEKAIHSWLIWSKILHFFNNMLESKE
jgi:hypothetical protein